MKKEIFTFKNHKAHSYVENSKLKTLSYGETSGVGVRVIVGNKQGFASALGKDIEQITRLAQDIALTSPEDPFVDISRGGRYPKISGIYDTSIDNIDMLETTNKLTQEFLTLAISTDSRISIDSMMIDIDKTHINIENTYDINISEDRTSFTFTMSGMAVDKEEVSSFDYIVVEDVNLNRFKERTKSEIIQFVERLVRSLHPKRPPSYKGLILLSPRAVEDIIIDFITYHLSGLRVVRNASIWKDKLGKEIASTKLTIIDNPLVDGSPYATAFDREGSPTSITVLIHKGILESFLHNTYSSKVLGMPNTSHASGGYSSIPGISPHCLKIDGTSKLENMMKMIDRGILLERFSGNINYQTGMVSGVAKNSFYIENGEIAYGITDTMVSFSLLDILTNIIDISQEVKMLSTGPMPYILVEGAQIIGR